MKTENNVISINSLFFILFAVALAISTSGCKQKGENIVLEESDTINNADTVIAPTRDLVFQDCNAIIVGEGVRLREAPNTNSEIIDNLSTGDLLKVVRTSDKKVLLQQDNRCNPYGFYWYEVITADRQRGWVYGEFVYQIVVKRRNSKVLHKNAERLLGKNISYNNKKHYFGFARSGIRTVKDEIDTSFCVDFLFPFFYNDNDNRVKPLKYIDNDLNDHAKLFNTKMKNYLRFVQAPSIIDIIDDFRIKTNYIELSVRRNIENQEKWIFKILIKPGRDFFTAEKLH